MSLTAAEVAEIMRLVEQSGFDELTLEIEGTKISIRRGAAPQTSDLPNQRAGDLGSAPASRDPASTAAPAAATPATDANVHLVASPLFGTFYRAPKPGTPPFIEVGAEVEEETVVGIIEVMKLMNTVRAGVRGTVIEIMVADGALAEYGETLLRVRKAG